MSTVRTRLTIVRATDVPRMDLVGHCDAYVKVKTVVSKKEVFRTRVLKATATPMWCESRWIDDEEQVQLRLFDEDTVSDEFIGAVVVDLREPLQQQPLALKDKDGKDVPKVRLVVSVEKFHPLFLPAEDSDAAAAGLVTINSRDPAAPKADGPTPVLAPEQIGKPVLPPVPSYTHHELYGGGAQFVPGVAPGAGTPDWAAAVMKDPTSALARYYAPIGLVPRLQVLGNFAAIDIIIDDSGSMGSRTDMLHPETGERMTRWEEVRWRLFQMLEVMACAPVLPPMTIRFLNREGEDHIERAPKETAVDFMRRVGEQLTQLWAKGTTGTTPVMAALQKSFAAHEGKPTIRYFFGDGVPNEPVRDVIQLVMNRANPEKNPFTFFSCTNNDKETEWMKQCEEATTFCAEYDDFRDETAEIFHDQGLFFPYTMGFYLMTCALGAMFPEDLDAMDEGVPLTKGSLDHLLGYFTTPQQYSAYFDGVIHACNEARAAFKGTPPGPQRVKFEHTDVWAGLKAEFAAAPLASAIPQVAAYREKLNAAVAAKRKW